MALRMPVSTDNAPAAIGPYSQAIRTGPPAVLLGPGPARPVERRARQGGRRGARRGAASRTSGGVRGRRRLAVPGGPLHRLPDRHGRLRARERGLRRVLRSEEDPPARVAIGVPRCRRARTSRSTRSSRSRSRAAAPASTSRWSPRSTSARRRSSASCTSTKRVYSGGEAEPDRVRAAEVRDHLGALDERAADRPGLVVANAHVAAAPRRVARAAELEAERREPGVVQLDEVGGERLRLGPQAADAGLATSLAPSSIATSAGTFGVPARKPRTPGSGS